MVGAGRVQVHFLKKIYIRLPVSRIFRIPFIFFITCSRFLGRTIFPPSMKKSMVLSKPAKPMFQVRSRKESFRESVCPPFGTGRGVSFFGRYSRKVYQETAPRTRPPNRPPAFNMFLNK